jgi:hypothetical protein
LKTQKRNPRAIQIDGEKEFVNEKLIKWCKENGIEVYLTAPYSPAQNGVAERMNRTLVELARAMLIGQKLPEFLWKHAVLHTGYLRNRTYTKKLETTPYQGWFNEKPNVTYLREFGALVWVLLQGIKENRKLLPKLKRQYYVGFEDGPKVIKYYNPETRKVLTSRNYRHLNSTANQDPTEEIAIEGGVTGNDDMQY